MARSGRKTKLTPEIAKKIIQALQGGATRRVAIGTVSISEQTFYNWLARGERAARGRFFEFFEAVSRAEAAAALRNITIIQKCAMGGEVIKRITLTRPDGTQEVTEVKSQPNNSAAQWWLARRFPEDWAEKSRIEHTAPNGPIAQTNYIIIEDRIGRSIEQSRTDHVIEVTPVLGSPD
jgi:hypothetical protein